MKPRYSEGSLIGTFYDMSPDRPSVLDFAGAMKLSYELSQIYSYKLWAKLQCKIRCKLTNSINFLKLSEAEKRFEPAILGI